MTNTATPKWDVYHKTGASWSLVAIVEGATLDDALGALTPEMFGLDKPALVTEIYSALDPDINVHLVGGPEDRQDRRFALAPEREPWMVRVYRIE